ncbi:MAG: hypothetical protein MZV70_66140 [Desulfobacterales bacterium]|nr:hypothetical protein [Desulfobacterales bacterium]
MRLFAVVFVMTLIVTFSATPLYLATTKVLIEKAEPNNIGMMNMYYMPYDPDFYETQYQLIKSTPSPGKVVRCSPSTGTMMHTSRAKSRASSAGPSVVPDAYAVVRTSPAGQSPKAGPSPGWNPRRSLKRRRTPLRGRSARPLS